MYCTLPFHNLWISLFIICSFYTLMLFLYSLLLLWTCEMLFLYSLLLIWTCEMLFLYSLLLIWTCEMLFLYSLLLIWTCEMLFLYSLLLIWNCEMLFLYSLLLIWTCEMLFLYSLSGFEINARPLARGDWKPRGMSRIFAQVVRRASGYFNLFCQLYVTLNETNY